MGKLIPRKNFSKGETGVSFLYCNINNFIYSKFGFSYKHFKTRIKY